jgi:hypothetical protein
MLRLAWALPHLDMGAAAGRMALEVWENNTRPDVRGFSPMALRIEVEKTATGERAYFVRRYCPVDLRKPASAAHPHDMIEVFQSDDFAQCRAFVRGWNESTIALRRAMEISDANAVYPAIHVTEARL